MGVVTGGAETPIPGPNEALAREVVERAWHAGVRTFIVCPGGRNAPLVEVLGRIGPDLAEVLHFYDERSAAFFALGRAKRDARPVAVVTTSGTAAAELLPALVEAFYEGERIVAVTADRPKRFRGTGAPQTIDQRGLYGSHVVWSADLDQAGSEWSLAGAAGPCHVNVCFDEPLLGGWLGAPLALGGGAGQAGDPGKAPPPAGDVEAVRSFLDAHPRPLVIVGALDDAGDRPAVADFCLAFGAPVLAEASSHLWGALAPVMLQGREASARALLRGGTIGAVLRIGGVPSFRVWRDLESRPDVPVMSVSRRPWPGLTHGPCIQAARDRRPPLPLPAPAATWPDRERGEIVAADASRAAAVAGLLSRYPASEPALVARLSRTVPRGSSVYLGNSLPIREWNEFAVCDDRGFTMRESRGVNGIDGQVSTFLGGAEAGRENWAIVGDLTALYDLAGPWALRHLQGVRTRIVVINNGGGRIFGRLFENPAFQNLHTTGFEGWATLWSVPWTGDLAVPDDEPAAIVELRPDEAQTTAFWAAWGALRS